MAEDSSEIVKEAAETVSFANVKTVAEQPAVISNLALMNAVSHQQAMNQLALAGAAKAIQMLVEVSPSEAGGDVAALAQLLKGMYMTPPVGNSGAATV